MQEMEAPGPSAWPWLMASGLSQPCPVPKSTAGVTPELVTSCLASLPHPNPVGISLELGAFGGPAQPGPTPTSTHKPLEQDWISCMDSTAGRWHSLIQALHGSHSNPGHPCLKNNFPAWLSTSKAQGKEVGTPGLSSPPGR